MSEWRNCWEKLVSEDSESTLSTRCIQLGLSALTLPYGLAVWGRNQLYACKGFRTHHFDRLRVISVGNLALGGRGKTPWVQYLARQFIDKGFSTAILSRGYASKASRSSLPICVGLSDTADEVGDEPLLHKRLIPTSEVIVCPNRALSAEMALKKGCEVVILDDGMQHRRLFRNDEICLLDVTDLKGRLFPRGRLREPLSGLRRATWIGLSGANTPEEQCEAMGMIRKWSSAPVSFFRIATTSEVSLKGKKVGVICAIAHPQRVDRGVRLLGAEVIATQHFPDHAVITEEEIHAFAKHVHELGGEVLVWTQKDAVKHREGVKVEGFSLPLYTLSGELEWTGGESLDAIIF